MASDGTKTAAEIGAVGDGLYAWVREIGGVLAIAAVLGRDEASGGMAAAPEALIAGSVGAFSEGEVAVLLAQIEVAAITLISKMAPDADMGEESFLRIARTARRRMLEAEGMGLCDECGG